MRDGARRANRKTDDTLAEAADHNECAHELVRAIAAGERSPVDVVDAAFRRIAEVQPLLNPFCALYEEEARRLAAEAETALVRGETLPALHGLPIAIKDFTPMAGKVTTRGSHAFRDFVPDYDPVIVRRLKEAGAIVVGKTTTPEFAFSSFTESPLLGITRNPWDPARSPGGSSGGSAVAVATGCAALAEGTDMGGSVRIPAALCGIVGLKPSLGRIPMDILSTTFDQISHFGPLARCVADAALFVSATQGPDDADIQSLCERPDYHGIESTSLEGRRIALSLDLGFFAVDSDVERNTLVAAQRLRDLGARVEAVDLGWTRDVIDAWYTGWGVFLSAAFGELRERFEAYMDPGVLALMAAGDRVSAVDFKRLEFVRTTQWRRLAEVFRNHDALICPTMTRTAPLVGRTDGDFEWQDAAGYHSLDMTSPFNNVAQCPVLSLPSGVGDDGLPTAVQIVGRRFGERGVFEIGARLEQALDFARWHPGILGEQTAG